MKVKKIVVLFLIFAGTLCVSDLAAQNEPTQPPSTQQQPTQAPAKPREGQVPTNLGDTRVDDMSDAQLRQLRQRMGEGQMTEGQLEDAARARGMNSSEIQKFKNRVSELDNRGKRRDDSQEGRRRYEDPDGEGNEQDEERVKKEDNGDEDEDEDIDDEDKKDEDQEDEEDANRKGRLSDDSGAPISRIFGSQMFRSGFQSFEPNLRIATPANYVIGPDDVLLLDLTGDNEASYKLTVSTEGFISLEYVGRVSVGGLTIEQARSKLKAQMSGTYPALRSGRSQIALNVGNIRSIKVMINGEVTKPGTYTLPSVASVFNALYASGGPNQNGSFRNIQVIRANNVVATVDLYDFLINGIQTGNIRLEDQDIIHIPVYQIRVDVLGEVKRSAIYEIRPEESLLDVLKYAGGFSDMAYKARVKIIQNTPNAQKIIVKPMNEFPDFWPKNGDKVFVDPIFERFENQIRITGAVSRPGIFEFKPGMTLTQLIQQADGLTPDVFMNRGFIIRSTSNTTPSLVSFDVAEVMKGGAADIPLQLNDVVQVSSIFDLRDEQTVRITGQVRNPGSYNFSDGTTVADMIQRAGGFAQGANAMNIEVSRRIQRADLTQKTAPMAEVFHVNVDDSLSIHEVGFKLEPFDIVSVRPVSGYAAQQQVQVVGEVLNPGVYTIKTKNERISDIIKRSGGLTAFAYKEGASLKRPESDDELTRRLDQEEARLRVLNLQRVSKGQDEPQEVAENAAEAARAASDLVGIELSKIMSNPQSRHDLILRDGDIIRVPSVLQTVKVTGEVLRPINVVYAPGRSMKYYIRSAGGFTKKAQKGRSFVSHSNGSVDATSKILFFRKYPGIKPGSEIAVPERVAREKLPPQAWIGMSTGFATLAAIIFAIINSNRR